MRLQPNPLPPQNTPLPLLYSALINGPALARILRLLGIPDPNHPLLCDQTNTFIHIELFINDTPLLLLNPNPTLIQDLTVQQATK